MSEDVIKVIVGLGVIIAGLYFSSKRNGGNNDNGNNNNNSGRGNGGGGGFNLPFGNKNQSSRRDPFGGPSQGPSRRDPFGSNNNNDRRGLF